MDLNVFRWSWLKKYYILRPWKWFSELISNFKAAWRRATKGYCYCDVWNWNDWFCSVVPPMLRDMADKGMAYPGGEPFDTKEKWENWLHELADKIERLGYDDWMEDLNEYSKDYEKTFEDDAYKEEHPNGPFITTTYDSSLSKEEIRKRYYERCAEIHKMRQQALEEVFLELGRNFDCLWD